jgi:hypothetical protein
MLSLRPRGAPTTPSLAPPLTPPRYEAKLFKRLPLPPPIVRAVLGSLTTDDIYLRSVAFPSTYHRSIRLAPQASMLYVCLHFDMESLTSNDRAMREIVDRYFNDNWVIALYMCVPPQPITRPTPASSANPLALPFALASLAHRGMVVDLTDEWSRFPAAKAALDNVVRTKQVRVRAK